MQFETMVVLAAATGRTLVLPPDNPLYLLRKEEGNPHRGIQDFFQGFEDVVDTISIGDFFQKERASYPLPSDKENRKRIEASVQNCYWIAKMDNSCFFLFDYLARLADLVPTWHSEQHCLIMDDEGWFRGGQGDENDARKRQVAKFCARRQPVYYDTDVQNATLLHVRSHLKDTRLLAHFYAFVHFTNPRVDNHYKRLVRDRVRYTDAIFCAAGKVVAALSAGSGGYFAMHIRRGDFQWRKMRLSAEEWYENTRSWLRPDQSELLYIATDEKDRTFFEPLMKHYKVSFLDDYAALAGLADLDPNFVGMIDQVVASRSSVFVGTYFSSFSAYIGRMRGYHGLSGKKMYYSHPDYWNQTHNWVYPHSSYSAREYPLGWVGIDKDDESSEADFY